MSLTELLAAVEHPFPGLRSFDTGESLLFFGREDHTQQLLHGLATGRFLAVVGSSGSGKSSLVRSGLLPALYRGYLSGANTRWRIAVMRPGNSPLANLARALSAPEALGEGDEEARLKLLSSSSMGLVEVVRQAELNEGESVLIVADQFEELFRYRGQKAKDDGGAEAALFVSALLQAADRFDVSIYVVLTMRSDFLGDCAQYPGLAEALSRTQYLIPRLTREQRQQAIERPLHLAGTRISTRLVQQLLNDSADDLQPAAAVRRGGTPDPLPVLQHALTRTYRHWKESGANGELDIDHYVAVGRIAGALDQHADALYESLMPSGKTYAAKIFRTLTTTELGRPIRRPTQLDHLCQIAGAVTPAQRDDLYAVLRVFGSRENSLVLFSSPDGLSPDSIIDIAHESLIWKWHRLQSWVRQESVSAEWYIDLAKDVEQNTALWRDPKLGHAERLAKNEGWNHSWAAQYVPAATLPFSRAQEFLARSRSAVRREKLFRFGAATLIVAALVVAGYYQYKSREMAKSNAELQETIRFDRARQLEIEQGARDLQAELDALKSRPAQLSPADQARREVEIKQLEDRLKTANDEALKLRKQQDYAQQMISGNENLATANRRLQERVSDLQDQFDTATREIGRLKNLLNSSDRGSKEGPANNPLQTAQTANVGAAQKGGATAIPALRTYEVRFTSLQVLEDGSGGATDWELLLAVNSTLLLDWHGRSLNNDRKVPYLPRIDEGVVTVQVHDPSELKLLISAGHSSGKAKFVHAERTLPVSDEITERLAFPNPKEGSFVLKFSVKAK